MKTHNGKDLEKGENYNTNGWICLNRKLLEKGYYTNSKYVHLWVHLLLTANHKPKEFMWNNKIITVNCGQLIIGRISLSKQTKISETTIERILELFEKEGQIGQQKTNKYRLITIINWDRYQKADNRRTTDGQQTDTNNNDNNDNNDNNRDGNPQKTIKYLENLPLDVKREFSEKYNCSQDDVSLKAEMIVNWCKSKKKKYADYRSALQNWLLRDYGKRKENYLAHKK